MPAATRRLCAPAWLAAAAVWVAPTVRAAPAVEAAASAEESPRPASYDWPPFANWDCVGVKGVLDWDALYALVMRSLRAAEPNFVLPDQVVDGLTLKGGEAYTECPLGTLYFLVLYTYEMINGNSEIAAVRQADHLKRTMRQYPFFVIAAGRWPTLEALSHFAPVHRPTNEKAAKSTLCEDVHGESGIDWQALLAAALRWSDDQLKGLEPGEGDPSDARVMKAAADAVYRNPRTAGAAAQEECPFGFLFLCTTQALASAVRLTGTFEAWARALDKMLAELPFFSIAGSKWPTFRTLAMFSSLSKGEEGKVGKVFGEFQADVHRWGGVHPATKRFRQYGDLRLTEGELAPLGRSRSGWDNVDRLVELSPAEWYANLAPHRLGRLRPVMAGALDAALATVRTATLVARLECGYSGISPESCRARGCRWLEPPAELAGTPWCLQPAPERKVVGVTFVWGERWSSLVPRFAAWAVKLRMSVIIVAMGDTCRQACEFATRALGSTTGSGVACWDPLYSATDTSSGQNAERGSILQRHAIVHLLLHLGVDVVAFDFDTFFFSDPRPRLEAIATERGADILMARHLDADCLNMGLLYVRASSRTAEWYSRYLEWLHQHPFEREQRGANALLGFTKQAVSFPPKSLPQVTAAALDDAAEFVSSRGGWHGDWQQLRFFHWVNPWRTLQNWLDIKISDLRGLYEAALHHSTDLTAVGGSFARMLGEATPGSYLYPVREVLESMRVGELPERKECW